MKKNLRSILTLVLVFVVHLSFAQEKTITGEVVDVDGLPIPGVVIKLKGTQQGTQTDFDGKYSIEASSNQTLVFTYIGYQKQEIPVGNQTTIDVTLEQGSEELEEVVVTGYATSSLTRSTVSSERVTAKTIENRPNSSFVQTLSGQVAGLNINTSSGQPGANSTVRIRGVNSINGNTEPLFIIDGAPVDEDNFRSLNPQDIASIDVLKDAAATSIYGNRGANGVIVIETKRGSFETGLDISSSTIISSNFQQDNDYDLMNGQEKLRLEREFGSGVGADFTDEEIANAPNTDWLDYFFDPTLSITQNLSFSSGGSNSSQYTSIGYSDIDGLLIDSDLQRFNIRNNLNTKSKDGKFNLSTNLSVNFSKSNEPSNIGTGAINRNFILGALQSLPHIGADEYEQGTAGTAGDRSLFQNTPLLLIDRRKTFERLEEELKIVGSINATYKIIDELTASSTTSIDYADEVRGSQESPESFNAQFFAEDGNETPGFQNNRKRRQLFFNQVTSLNYSDTFEGIHSLDIGAYTEYVKNHLRLFGFTNNGLNPKTFAFQDGAGYIGDNAANDFFSNTVFATKRDGGLFSYFGNLSYDYDERFGFNGTIRRDASYRFSESNTWGTFYAVSGRWNIDNEEFMDNTGVDVLKLRASYGTAGNQRITGNTPFSAPDLYLNLFRSGGGYQGQNALFLSQIANTTLIWEEVRTENLGIDFGFFNNRLRGSFDIYDKKTTNLFQSKPVSAINATTSLNANVGSLTNKGFDFSIDYNVIQPKRQGDLGISVNANGNYNQTELIDLPSDDGVIEGIGRNGGKLNEYQVVRYAGVNPANGNLLYKDADGNLTESPDADTDRVFTDKNIYPDFEGGFSLNIDYKNFFLTAQFNYVLGVDRFDFNYSGFVDPNNIVNFNSSNDLNRAWTPDNRVTDIPSLTASNYTLLGAGQSDRFIVDASYLRMRFAQFGYGFSKKQLAGTGLTNARIFVNGENLLTFSEWRGIDPEAQNNTSRLYPTPRILSFGLEIGL